MRYEFLNREHSPNLILIFAGWSTDTRFYSDISLPGWDVLVVSEYDSPDFPTQILDGYSTICLFAWSLGVFAASMVIPPRRLAMAIAVNGTECPVHDRLGIPEQVFSGTESTLSERNLLKFQRRMAAGSFSAISSRLPAPDIDALRGQLSFILSSSRKAADSPQRGEGIHWNRVYISTQDRIFPPANQKAAWMSHPSSPEIIEIDAPHYLPLMPVIRPSLPDPQKVARRFLRALPTYDNEATAQKRIAARLVELSPDTEAGRIAELGPGSGIFTRLFSRRFHPSATDYVDLYPLPVFGEAPCERYHVMNAERWIADEAASHPGSLDAIVSASTIQWFLNPAEFFSNAARLLRPGGFLACSTFLPGNLREITHLNPHGLIYRSAAEIREMLSGHFMSFSLEEEEITIGFSSRRHTLMHLRDTGVGGSCSSGLPLHEVMERMPLSLTYRPLYIIARK